MKVAFYDTRYQDHDDQKDSDVSWALPLGKDRVEEGPMRLENDNYLYKDENADRFNSWIDPNQRHGQPKGYSPKIGPISDFGRDEVFDKGDEVKTFKNEEKIIDDIKHEQRSS
ncbi:MAG: hypothetical protein Q7R33_01995 [Nitrosarchaeum sp.]|nr:hypothetical protein [Nitrosarchaeum sp.]